MGGADVALDALIDAKECMPDEVAHATDGEDNGPDGRRAIARWNGVPPGGAARAIHRHRQGQERRENDEARVEDGVPGGEEALVDLAVIRRPAIQGDSANQAASP